MRAFLAIVPDHNLQRQLMAVIHGLQDQHGLKLTSQEKLHLTLHFFADLKSEEAAPILTVLSSVLKNNFPLSLQLGKKVLLPNETQASVLAYQVELTQNLSMMKALIDEELLKAIDLKRLETENIKDSYGARLALVCIWKALIIQGLIDLSHEPVE